MAWTETIDSDNALVSVDQAQAFLNDTTDANTVIITFWINAASRFCNEQTRRLLKSRTLTEYYSGDGTKTLFTRQYPITTLTSVHDDLDRSYGSDTALDTDDLALLPQDVAYKIVYDGGIFNRGIKNLKVVYVAGYTTVPYDLQEACLEIIAYWYKNHKEGRFGLTSRNIGDGSINIETTEIPKSAYTVLQRYKKKW